MIDQIISELDIHQKIELLEFLDYQVKLEECVCTRPICLYGTPREATAQIYKIYDKEGNPLPTWRENNSEPAVYHSDYSAQLVDELLGQELKEHMALVIKMLFAHCKHMRKQPLVKEPQGNQ